MLCFNNVFAKRASFSFVIFFLVSELSFPLVKCDQVSSAQFTVRTKEKFRILGLFHHPGKSHFDVFKPLLEELAHRGHDLTIVSYFPRNVNDSNVKYLPNYKDIDLSGSVDKWLNIVDMSKIDYSIISFIHEIHLLRQWALEHCQAALNIPEVRQLIKSDAKFDLIITEMFNSDCFLGFVHRFQAPFISLQSHEILPWANSRIGNPDNPSYIPASLMAFKPQMTFFQRTANSLFLYSVKVFYEIGFQWYTQRIVEDVFGPGIPPLSEIAKNISALLPNIHHSLFGARPHVPNVVEIGGIHIKPVKPLPEDIQKFLDDATEGVLLFSWGSMINASTLPDKKLKSINKVLSEIPKKVIWKWEIDRLPEMSDNIMIKKWIPQFDILSEYKDKIVNL